MRIKKFVISNITLSIILITILYGLSWFYINYVNDRTVKFMEYSKLSDNSVDIVTLGSSHAKFGIKFDKENQMNLGLESQDFYYNLKLLKKYENKLKKDAIIIIPISIFNFYENNKGIYRNYINLLEKKEIRKEIKESEYFFSKNFSIIYPPARLIETIKYLFKYKTKKNYITYERDLRGEELTKEAKGTAKGHTKVLVDDYEKKGIEFLNNLLEYLGNKRYRAIFIITPYWHEYTDELEKIEKNIFDNRIYKNVKKIEDIREKKYIFLDYSNDKRFKNSVEYFMDDDHLNEKGAEYFTEILLKDIEKEIKNEREI